MISALGRRPAARLANALMVAAWFAAPLTALTIRSVKVADGLLIVALIASLGLNRGRPTAGTFYFPRPARWHAVAILLMAAGLVTGLVRSAAPLGAIIEVVGYASFAVIPLVLVLRARADEALRHLLIAAVAAGTVVSVAGGVLGGEVSGQGRALGLTTHMNQLGMTAACGIVLVWYLMDATRRHRLFGVGVMVFLVWGLNATGSRSALLGLAVAGLLLIGGWLRRHTNLAFTLSAFALAVVVATSLIGPTDSGQSVPDSAIARLAGDSTAESSDVRRLDLLESSLEGADPSDFVLGGATPERSPHNVFLELAIVGGLAAVAGAMVAFGPALWFSLRGTFSVEARQAREVYYLSVAVAAFVVWVSFNNAVWVRYIWCILAVLVAARTSHASDRRSELAGDTCRNRDVVVV